MTLELQQHRPSIQALCRRYGVRRLELFGSAAAGTFDPDASDYDFFVEFLQSGAGEAWADYFDLQRDLERLLGRPVHLVERNAVTNPYFLEVANRHRAVLYAA